MAQHKGIPKDDIKAPGRNYILVSKLFSFYQAIDINMMCNTNLTVQAGGKCQCKPDMKWNEASGECQV